MEIGVKLIKNALRERRRLTDKELELFIVDMLKKYKVLPEIEKINFDYSRKEVDERVILGNYRHVDNVITFNMASLNQQVFESYKLSYLRYPL